jgi:hypothetical protein
MNKMTDELKNINNYLKNISIKFNKRKDLKRIHRDNEFNRRYSVVLSAFSDIESFALRLETNIIKFELIERKIQKRNYCEDKDMIHEDGQKLRREADKINKQNVADFKSLYVFAKIFLDNYTKLITFIFNWRSIDRGSVTGFYHSLNNYNNDD